MVPAHRTYNYIRNKLHCPAHGPTLSSAPGPAQFLALWLPSISLTTDAALSTMDDPQHLLTLKMCISCCLRPLDSFPLSLSCSSLSTVYLFLFTSLTLVFGLIFMKLTSISATVYLYDYYGIVIIYYLLLHFLLSSELLCFLVVKILRHLALYTLHVCCMELYFLLLIFYV